MALKKLGPAGNHDDASLNWEAVRDAVDQMARAAANHVEKEHFLVLWESIQVNHRASPPLIGWITDVYGSNMTIDQWLAYRQNHCP